MYFFIDLCISYRGRRRYSNTTYWGFGFEGLPSAAERQSARQRVLSWCSFQADLSLQQAVSPLAALRPGQPLTYTLSYKNDGVAIASKKLWS